MDSSTQAQTTPGASNAADFQPPTRNPQSAPAQLFQQDNSPQSSSVDQILQNRNARIQVPVNPAPAPAEVAEAKSNDWLVFSVVVVAIVLVSLHFWRRRTTFLTKTPSTASLPKTPDDQLTNTSASMPKPVVKKAKKPNRKQPQWKKKKRR
jgi:hypothetical protein